MWNWGSGPDKEWKYASCKQSSLKASGGHSKNKKDTDALTFNSGSYWVHFQDRGGKKFELKKGVWTKIRDTEVASCSWSQSLKAPLCTIFFDPSPFD
ncbi:hypothetical protein AB0B50_19520 [Streptomyces sp. NPDC041068]|uniref:hypothetical protein n=1 Tax=Streptomyces sp. NPDC041068 TaxID=3155130 RepID=UPI0033E6EF8F